VRAILVSQLALAVLVGAACNNSSTAAATSCASSGAAATITASDARTFAPTSASVTHGQSVCWQNTGTIAHTVTSNDGTSFNTSLPAGQVFTYTFPTAGSFPYHCTIHAGMTGTITVN
jgi:plastocyanin